MFVDVLIFDLDTFLLFNLYDRTKLSKATALLHSLNRTDFDNRNRYQTYRTHFFEAHIFIERTFVWSHWNEFWTLQKMWMQPPSHIHTYPRIITEFIWARFNANKFHTFEWNTQLIHSCHVHLPQFPLSLPHALIPTSCFAIWLDLPHDSTTLSSYTLSHIVGAITSRWTETEHFFPYIVEHLLVRMAYPWIYLCMSMSCHDDEVERVCFASFCSWPYAALTLFAHVKNKYDTTNGNKKWENRGKYGCFCFLIIK